MIDRYPLAIVRAASPADIPPVLEAARETGLPLAVRGGGHSIAGLGTVDDGIVLDLGDLTDVQVDPDSRRVTVAPGARSRSEEHTSELQSRGHLVCRLLLVKKKRMTAHEKA